MTLGPLNNGAGPEGSHYPTLNLQQLFLDIRKKKHPGIASKLLKWLFLQCGIEVLLSVLFGLFAHLYFLIFYKEYALPI